MGGITPKWLTNRLRELEAAGIVERDSEEGRREVWYRLTPKGRDLAPVLESLTVWGINHAMRPPEPGESLYPEVFLQGTTTYFNSRGLKLPWPATWLFRFDKGSPVAVYFDGQRWSAISGEAEADVVATTTAADLLAFLMARASQRGPLLDALHLEGSPKALAAFRTALVREPAAAR
jgi:DNA-binding MarR family transcriptional regulator